MNECMTRINWRIELKSHKKSILWIFFVKRKKSDNEESNSYIFMGYLKLYYYYRHKCDVVHSRLRTSRLKILPKYKVLPPHPLKVGRDLVLKDLYDIKEAIS